MFVVYLRVSTQRQGASGLGLEAQQEAVTRYAESVGQPIIATFTEIEGGSVTLGSFSKPRCSLARCQTSG